jgi:hypothetical protein
MSGAHVARIVTGMSSSLIQRLRLQLRRASASLSVAFPADHYLSQAGQPRLRDYPVARRR